MADDEEGTMPRRLLKTYPTRFEAEIVRDQLQAIQVPVSLLQPAPNLGWKGSNAMTELWLEDDKLLDDPDVRAQIEVVVLPRSLPEESYDSISEMALPDEDTDPNTIGGLKIIAIAFLVVIVAGLILRFTTIP
jgi:hypothetical protein